MKKILKLFLLISISFIAFGIINFGIAKKAEAANPYQDTIFFVGESGSIDPQNSKKMIYQYNIYSIKKDGSGFNKLTSFSNELNTKGLTGQIILFKNWDQDGKIYFSLWDIDHYGIYSINFDGSGLVKIIDIDNTINDIFFGNVSSQYIEVFEASYDNIDRNYTMTRDAFFKNNSLYYTIDKNFTMWNGYKEYDYTTSYFDSDGKYIYADYDDGIGLTKNSIYKLDLDSKTTNKIIDSPSSSGQIDNVWRSCDGTSNIISASSTVSAYNMFIYYSQSDFSSLKNIYNINASSSAGSYDPNYYYNGNDKNSLVIQNDYKIYDNNGLILKSESVPTVTLFGNAYNLSVSGSYGYNNVGNITVRIPWDYYNPYNANTLMQYYNSITDSSPSLNINFYNAPYLLSGIDSTMLLDTVSCSVPTPAPPKIIDHYPKNGDVVCPMKFKIIYDQSMDTTIDLTKSSNLAGFSVTPLNNESGNSLTFINTNMIDTGYGKFYWDKTNVANDTLVLEITNPAAYTTSGRSLFVPTVQYNYINSFTGPSNIKSANGLSPVSNVVPNYSSDSFSISTSCSAPTCTDTTWSPDPSTQCNGINFTQTSDCTKTTRSATGTKTSGACTIVCSDNPQCGASGLIGSPTCSANNVVQDYQAWTCNNPGTTSSTCTSSTASQVQKTCNANETCTSGACITNSYATDLTITPKVKRTDTNGNLVDKNVQYSSATNTFGENAAGYEPVRVGDQVILTQLMKDNTGSTMMGNYKYTCVNSDDANDNSCQITGDSASAQTTKLGESGTYTITITAVDSKGNSLDGANLSRIIIIKVPKLQTLQ